MPQASADVLERLFQVRATQRTRMVLLCLAAATAMGASVIGRAVGNALFLARLPPEAVPYRYVFAGGALALATLASWELLGRMRQDRFVAGALAALAVTAAASYLLVSAAPFDFWVLASAHAFGELAGALVLVHVLGVVRASFTDGEARRLAPVVAVAAAVGTAAMGGAVLVASRQVAPVDLLLVAAVGYAFAAALVASLGALPNRFAPDRSLATPAPGVRAEVARIARSPLPATVGAMVLLSAAAVTVADFLLALTLQQTHGEAGMTGFYGAFAFCGTALALTVQLALANRVLERFGVLVALLLLPCAMVVGIVVVVATGADLRAVTALRMMPVVFGVAWIHAAGVLFLPVAPDFRPRALALLRGIALPFATMATGAALAIGPARHVLLPLLLVLAAWVALSFAAWRVYIGALTQQLRGRHLLSERLPPRDRGTRRSLAAALHEDAPSRILHAFELIDALDDPKVWCEEVTHLLRHSSELVRIRAIRLLGRGTLERHADLVRSMLTDPHPDVRAAAIEALCEIAGAAAVPDFEALLRDPAPPVRSAVVIGLMQVGGARGTRLASDEVRRMVIADDPALRSAAARVLGTFYATPLRELLLTLLADPAVEVRVAALEVAGASADPPLLPKLVIGLQDRRTAPTAARALARFGHGVERDIGFGIDDARRPVATRQFLARILGRMGTPLAGEMLAARVNTPSEPVRTAIHEALARVVVAGRCRPDRAQLELVIVEEVAIAEAWLAIRRDLGEAARGSLLEDALRTRQRRAVERALSLLRALWPRREAVLERLHTVWRGGGTAPAAAIALVGQLLPGPVGMRLYGLLAEDEDTDLPARTVYERIEELLNGDDEWLRLCAMHFAGERELRAHEPAVMGILLEQVPELVRDTAQRALRRMTDPEREPSEERRMFTTVEKVLYLKRVALFARVPAEELVGVADIAKPTWFDPGQTIFERGQDGDSLYLIVFGEVEVRSGERRLATLGPGEVFGEMALLDAEPRSATVIAATNLNTLRIGREEFHDLIDERPEVLRGIVKVLTARLRTAAG